MTDTVTMDLRTADAIIRGIDKQALFGRLRQHGEVPKTEKEASALLDLSYTLAEDYPEGAAPAANNSQYGDGFYAHVKRAYDQTRSEEEIAPGFPKHASDAVKAAGERFPEALVDAAFTAAYELSLDPNVYQAAVIKRAAYEQALAEYDPQAAG